ncbi:MAG: TolC family protein, partial [Candidatus Rokubacteria bacterium]|nr:TolC family protein [Candidatus Rokubacteria bacterium]
MRRTAGALLVGVMCVSPGASAQAQAPAETSPPAPPASATPPPPAARVAGRVITLDEAVAIALEGQPQIQARLFDYAAARYRVDQALAPLLPQLTGSVSATKSQSVSLTTSAATGETSTVFFSRGLGDTFLAQMALSQLLFDFGKNMAARDAAQKLAAVALEDIELQ